MSAKSMTWNEVEIGVPMMAVDNQDRGMFAFVLKQRKPDVDAADIVWVSYLLKDLKRISSGELQDEWEEEEGVVGDGNNGVFAVNMRNATEAEIKAWSFPKVEPVLKMVWREFGDEAHLVAVPENELLPTDKPFKYY